MLIYSSSLGQLISSRFSIWNLLLGIYFISCSYKLIKLWVLVQPNQAFILYI